MAAEALPRIQLPDTQDKETSPGDVGRRASATSEGDVPLTEDGQVKDPNGLDKDEERPATSVNASKDGSHVRADSNPTKRPEQPSQNNGDLTTDTTLQKTLTKPGGGPQDQSTTAMDPLSQQILKRTAPSKPQRLPSAIGESKAVGQTSTRDSLDPQKRSIEGRVDLAPTATKDKRKGVSFLTRFIGGNKKKDDDESELGDTRPEGMDAQLFSQPINNLGFSPHHPMPPAYIRMKSRYKREREYDRVFLSQELRARGTPDPRKRISSGANKGPSSASLSGNDPIWAMEFSKDGKYLAAAGQDKTVRVWMVISSPQERRTHEKEEEAAEAPGTEALHLSAPVFQKNIFRTYTGHTATVLDVSWSKNNFLLSSSMDKTVRLWHISRNECLCTFKHSDFVPSIQFHPRDDRFFLAGSLDAKLRLWSIPDKSVAYWKQMTDMITAVSFTPDGKTAIAGTLSGICQFFDTEGLKPQTSMHVRSNRGKNAKGSKITGIQTMTIPPDNPNGDVKLLISSNDSRVRLYNYRDKSLEAKYKGHENNFSQIRASFSDDAQYIICGSEDRKAFIWSMGPAESENNAQQRPVEMFEAHAAICTAGIFAPTNTRQLLSNSEDPLYDLCNPPPVTLISKDKAESVTSSVQKNGVEKDEKDEKDDTKPPDQNGTNSPGTPTTTRPSSVQQTPSAMEENFRRIKESPNYVSRSAHPGGAIIVTADYSGCIKVFRQDCAWQKRQRAEMWDTGSVSNLRGRAGSVRSSLLGRTNSVATRTSRTSGSHRRRDSVRSHLTQPAGERILSWRQAIPSSGSQTPRSISPRKSTSQVSVSSSVRPSRLSGSALWTVVGRGDESLSRRGSGATTNEQSRPSISEQASTESSPVRERKKSASEDRGKEKKDDDAETTRKNPLWLSGNAQSYLFWNKNGPLWSSSKPSNLSSSQTVSSPPIVDAPEGEGGGKMAKRPSVVSALSSEQSSLSDQGKDDEVRCKRCQGTAFSARLVRPGQTKLVCQKCGRVAS